MTSYRFSLERGSKKYICPGCAKKTFVRYVNTSNGTFLPDKYGRCDREVNCGYQLNPYSDGYWKKLQESENGENGEALRTRYFLRPKMKTDLSGKLKNAGIPYETLKRTLRGYEGNVFLQNLLKHVPFPFDASDVEKVVALYHLGTITKDYRKGSVTFPFISFDGNVRAIQVKQFDQSNHSTGTDFLHAIQEKEYKAKNEDPPDWLKAYLQIELKVSCLFGERLLSKYPMNPVALVEAPKTAIYGTLYFGFPDRPQNLLWLAVYNLSSLNYEKCKVLQGRDVYLFPDLSKGGKAFNDWSKKAEQFASLMPGTRFKVSDFLEKAAPQSLREQGADIADVLINMDWREFRNKLLTPTYEERVLRFQASQTLQSENGEKSERLSKINFFETNSEALQKAVSDYRYGLMKDLMEKGYADCYNWMNQICIPATIAMRIIDELVSEFGFNTEE